MNFSKLLDWNPVTPGWLRRLFPELIWDVPSENSVFLTFDDGPTPEVTSFVLEQLAAYRAKATFFCVGNNMIKYPDLFMQILNEGHIAGNHTMSHKNGWLNTAEAYELEVSACEKAFPSTLHNRNPFRLFRPPYGKLTPSQIRVLLPKFKIIMWSLLSKDYLNEMNTDDILLLLKKNIKPGEIVVMHDSAKAFPKVKVVLPQILSWVYEKGWNVRALDDELLKQTSNHF